MLPRTLGPLCALALTASACASALRVHPIDAAVAPPAHVVLMFEAETKEGPVVGLDHGAVSLSEDDEPAAGPWTLTSPDLGAGQHTLLLLDFGGGIDGEQLREIAAAARIFSDVMAGTGKLAIYAFDGTPSVQRLVPFTTQVTAEQLQAIDDYRPRDPSVDLHGAYRDANAALAAAIAEQAHPVGTLVLVSRNPDRAARISLTALRRELSSPGPRIARVAIGLGPGAAEAPLDALSDYEPLQVSSSLDLSKQLFAVGERLKARGKSFYIVSYCSPARAGPHRLTVEVSVASSGEGGQAGRQSQSIDQDFDASGFGEGCNPAEPPSFAHAAKEPTDPGSAAPPRNKSARPGAAASPDEKPVDPGAPASPGK